jgi:hypothetical protein
VQNFNEILQRLHFFRKKKHNLKEKMVKFGFSKQVKVNSQNLIKFQRLKPPTLMKVAIILSNLVALIDHICIEEMQHEPK